MTLEGVFAASAWQTPPGYSVEISIYGAAEELAAAYALASIDRLELAD